MRILLAKTIDCVKDVLGHRRVSLTIQCYNSDKCSITVELQWLEHLWNHENLLETGVV